MRKVLLVLIGFSMLALFSAGGAAAQQTSTPSSGAPMLMNVDKLKGSDVVDPNGNKLGSVENVALDLSTGKISYIVVDRGLGKNLIPVPYGMFGLMRNEKLVLNVDKARLAQAPNFGRFSQPNWADRRFGRQVTNFWGSEPTGTMAGTGMQGSPSQPAPMGMQNR